MGLELGGKDAAYVRTDCDFAATVADVAEGAFYNAGQSCCGVERIYVQQPLYERFVEALCDEALRWRAGSPLDESTKLGPMAQPTALPAIAAQIDEAADKGAKVLVGGNAVQVVGAGRYFGLGLCRSLAEELAHDA